MEVEAMKSKAGKIESIDDWHAKNALDGAGKEKSCSTTE
jgi:hypothetical protein